MHGWQAPAVRLVLKRDESMVGDPGETASYLRIDGLSKRFDNVLAVDNVCLDIPQGQIFALLGSSGCGKSTLLRMIAGFETPSAGQILLGGRDIATLPPYERPINMMFQSYALFPHLSVWENVAFGLKRMAMLKDQIAIRVTQMLELVQMGNLAQRKPNTLSGGQQQRVALARSLARNPQLLLLDEPLGALDKKLRQQTQFELSRIISSVAVTCVMVTHDQEEAMTMASRIAVMSEGRILQVGTPSEIYEFPNCRFVADFIGNVNLLDGTLAGRSNGLREISVGAATIVAPAGDGAPGERMAVAIRPEKIQIGQAPPTGAANVLSGVVAEIAYLGSFSTYLVAVPGQAALRVTEVNRWHQVKGSIERGARVWCWWDPQSSLVLTS